MKKITNYQIWDFNDTTDITYLSDNEEVMCSYSYNSFKECKLNEIVLKNVYVQPKFRELKLLNKILADIIELNYDKIYLTVVKDSTIINKYKSVGFEYHSEHDDDDDYEWYVREK